MQTYLIEKILSQKTLVEQSVFYHISHSLFWISFNFVVNIDIRISPNKYKYKDVKALLHHTLQNKIDC